MAEGLIESYAEAVQTRLPILAANVTWIKVNGGRAVSSVADWDADRDPVIGEDVLISDGGPYVPARIDAVLADGEIRLTAPRYSRPVAAAV